jgi:hypothetical protein
LGEGPLRVSRIAIAAIAVMATTPALAQPLWQNTNVGMSESDVIKLYPDAKPVTMSGKEVLIKTEPMTVFGAPFTVAFQFDGEKLYQVRMQAMNTGDQNPLPNPMLTYMQVSDELIKRYGQPIKVDTSSLITSESKYFLNDGVSIKLNYMQMPSLASVSIEYESSVGGDNPL